MFFLLGTRIKIQVSEILVIPLLLVALLVLPFWFNDLDGVHRWLSLGPVNLYIASIILPLLIIHLWKLSLNNREHYVIGLIFITLIILLFHPDAGQLTAFACASAIILWKTIRKRMIKILSIILTIAFGIISWVSLDDLAPVPYVEHIIFLVADLGNIWFILGMFISYYYYYFHSFFTVKKISLLYH